MTDEVDDGRWGSVSEAAKAFDVSVDTIRRRMKKGELDTRREQTPQGFQWLIRLPDDAGKESPQNRPESPQTAAPIDQGSVIVYGPDPRDTLIETLQRELDLRNREVARLHEVIGRQWPSRRLRPRFPRKRRARMPQNRRKRTPRYQETSQTSRRRPNGAGASGIGCWGARREEQVPTRRSTSPASPAR